MLLSYEDDLRGLQEDPSDDAGLLTFVTDGMTPSEAKRAASNELLGNVTTSSSGLSELLNAGALLTTQDLPNATLALIHKRTAGRSLIINYQ